MENLNKNSIVEMVESKIDEEISVVDSMGIRVALIRAYANNAFNIVRIEVLFSSELDDEKNILSTIIDQKRLSFITQMLMIRYGEKAEDKIIDMVYDQIKIINDISEFTVLRHLKNEVVGFKTYLDEITDGKYFRVVPTNVTNGVDFAKIIVKYYKGNKPKVWEFIAVDKDGNELPEHPVPSKECVGNVIFEFSQNGDRMIDKYGRVFEVKKV